MKILLDTNIIIHREASKLVNEDIGILFQWLDKLHLTKCIHSLTEAELNKHLDRDTVKSMTIKLSSYHRLKTEAALHENVIKVTQNIDRTANDQNDTKLINEVYVGRVDALISEDKKVHSKALLLGINDKVFRIDSFLEKLIAENPDLIDYKVLAVKKEYFGNIPLADSFFDTFRSDYKNFDSWFAKKSDEIAYTCFNQEKISAFLYIKYESEEESYLDITPQFLPKKRLKVGTLKVASNGLKLGERFLKIIFDNALLFKVSEIYVTIFDKRPELLKLITFIEEWGFKFWGYKKSISGEERVYVRTFDKQADRNHPKTTFPFLSRESDIYIVPIYPEYHTELFPDSVLNTESKMDFIENQPHRNALSKVYISHSHEKNLMCGDIIVFYRTGGIYAGVATTIGIVENVIPEIKSLEELIQTCGKRTVLKAEEIKSFWNRYKTRKPFVVNFLYAHSFPKRPNLKQLLSLGVIKDISDMPRGFRRIDREIFNKLVKFAYRK